MNNIKLSEKFDFFLWKTRIMVDIKTGFYKYSAIYAHIPQAFPQVAFYPASN